MARVISAVERDLGQAFCMVAPARLRECDPNFKIGSVMTRMDVHRATASIYLQSLEKAGILQATRLGREVDSINSKPMRLLKG